MTKTKHSLIMSAIALLLCFSMLIGTTFAWFTDSVTSSGNKIQSGTLKVDLELLEKDGSWTSLKDVETKLFDYDKWEPGYTEIKILRIQNEGTLALKWVAQFVSENQLSKLADVIDVYVTTEMLTAYPTERDVINTWNKAGTVEEFVNTIATTTNGTLLANDGIAGSGADEAYLGLALKMREEAGNEYQNLDLGGAFDIRIYATQLNSEKDSIDENYDVAAAWTGTVNTDWYDFAATEYTIKSAEELAGLAKIVNEGTDSFEGKTVKLAANLDLNNIEWTPIGDADAGVFVGFKGTFDGQNFSIKNLKINSASWGKGLFGYMDNTTDATVKNFKVVNANVVASDCAGVIVGYATKGNFENIHVSGDVSVIGTLDKDGGYVGVIAGCGYNANFNNCSVNAKAGSEIASGCSFVGGIVGYQCNNAKTITDCKVSNLTITGYAAVGGVAGIIQTGTEFKNNTVENITLNKTRPDGNPSIGALIGTYSGTAATTLTGSASDVVLNGSHVAYSTYNVLYGSEYSGLTTSNFDVTGVTVTNVTNNLVEVSVAKNADALVGALESGENVLLGDDVKIEPAGMSNAYGKTGINVKNGQTIDGNGYVLDIKGAGGTWDSGISTTGGLIKNITITGSFRGVFVNHNSTHSERVVLENVIIDGTTYTISCDQGTNKGLTATKSTFKGWTSYAETIGDVEFIECKFGKGNGYAFCRPYAPTKFVSCEFEAGFKMDPRAAVTFENCTLGGVLITAENLADLVTSNIANATVIE